MIDRVAGYETLNQMVKHLGFSDTADFRNYMRSRATPGEFGGNNFNETRKGYQLNYSDNCKKVFGIGVNIRGTFREARFN